MRISLKCEREDLPRLDVFLADSLPELSRSGAQKLIEQGLVALEGGGALKKNHRPEPGQVFTVELPEPEPIDALPEDIPIDVVYEDADVIVVNKARGMVVHPAPGHPGGTLVNALLFHCGDSLSGIGGVRRPGIVHRIDKDTSGLIIAAKNDMAHMSLSEQLKDRSLSRVYEAVVHGRMKEPAGRVDLPIGRHPTDRKRQSVNSKTPRQAVTDYEVIAEYRGYSHIRCRLQTGRTHQIRVHMAAIGHPLLGDMVYGHKKPELGLEGQCLHARQLKFIHPSSGEAVELSSPLPDYFTEVLRKLERIGRIEDEDI